MRKKTAELEDRTEDAAQDEPGTVETPPAPCDCPAMDGTHRHWPDGPRAIADEATPADPA